VPQVGQQAVRDVDARGRDFPQAATQLDTGLGAVQGGPARLGRIAPFFELTQRMRRGAGGARNRDRVPGF
jgi:hypothetical protein